MRNFPYELDSSFDSTSRVARCVVTIRGATFPAERDLLLTETVFRVLEFLVDASTRARGGRCIVDLRLPDFTPTAALPGTLAFVEAVRGLVQSLTLEMDSGAPATNVIVSAESQDDSRNLTIAYLGGAGGAFSRGATYDLRRN